MAPSTGRAGGGSKKKTVPPAIPPEPQDNVVFGYIPRPGKTVEANGGRTKGEKSTAQAPSEDTSTRPDTRTLIGGASWTGKLPVNLLSEHCQKQKWAKPEYTMHRSSDAYSSMVILKSTNLKTKKLMDLPPFKLPPSHKHLANAPTAVEAKHFAATYALFRICSMRNVHMMLPPTYRDLWKNEFQELKETDLTAGRDWMYEADPFAAKLERDEMHAVNAKKKGVEEDERAKASNLSRLTRLTENAPLAGAVSAGRYDSHTNKAWSKAPKIDLGKRVRAQIEDLVRTRSVWNPNGLRVSERQRENITKELTKLNFRRSHIEEAIEECKDREEVLEWLLIHIPEDDLPEWSLPENYTAGLSMASGNLKREAAIERLARGGYSIELCGKVIDAFEGDEGLAAEALQNALVSGTVFRSENIDISKLNLEESSFMDTIWVEEGETLDAIYGDRFHRIANDIYEVQLQIKNMSSPMTLYIRKPKAYPSHPPLVALLAPNVASYIRLSIVRQVTVHAQATLLGEPMIFSLVDWLETEIFGILENPGKLRDLSVVISGNQVPGTIETKAKHRRDTRPSLTFRNVSKYSSAQLLSQWETRQSSPEQKKMLEGRKSLPAWNKQNSIVETVNSNQVTIISGETGSGKSTQSVQFVLDDMTQRDLGASANIICTQPRRISALSLADRVSDERCSLVGEEVGYAIRGESKQKSGHTKIIFVTTGVLLRRLQASGSSEDAIVASLAGISHVVVDEVHERNLDTDFLLVLLKIVLARQKGFKVILMSATLDAGIFERYFGSSSTVGLVAIEGRAYPVEDYYLDDVLRFSGFSTGSGNDNFENTSLDGPESGTETSVAGAILRNGMRTNYNLLAATVRAIDLQLGNQEGGILIFLPGTMEIDRALAAVQHVPHTHVLPLHASLTAVEQRRVFLPAPKGKRKVIAATNVAETSITIEDIVAVIDTGRVKETSFDPQNNMVKLEETWASRAACKQRRGRAGRVRPGVCYKLYTRNAESKMVERPEPEIRRVPLEQLCLSVRAMGIIDIPSFLARAITPPESLAVEGAIELLSRIGALDGDELTALGKHLSMIPADLRCSKLMVYGATFGCLEAALTIAAILTLRSPFISPQAKREESKAARAAFSPGQGDLICDLRAYEAWSELASRSSYRDVRQWCEQNFLSSRTLHDISANKTLYLSSLEQIGFLPSDYRSGDIRSASNLNVHNTNTALLRALIAGAFNPQLARIDFPGKKFVPSHSGAVEIDPEARTIKYFDQENARVFVHPSSTLFSAQNLPGDSAFVSFFNKVATSKVFIRELTPFNAYSAMMFGGSVALDTMGRGVLIDGWLRLRGWARIGVLVGRLRMMLDSLLARKIEEPRLDLVEDEVIKTLTKLVEYNGFDR